MEIETIPINEMPSGHVFSSSHIFYVCYTIKDYLSRVAKLPEEADLIFLEVSLSEFPLSDAMNPAGDSVIYQITKDCAMIDLPWPLKLRDREESGFVAEMGTDFHAPELFIRHTFKGAFIVQSLPRVVSLGRFEFIEFL